MKKIIAAALSVLIGSLGLTVVDKTLESRVATLESEVVELREEVSKNKNNTDYENPQIEEIKLGQVIPKDIDFLSEFLFRKYADGRIQSYNKYDQKNAATYPKMKGAFSYGIAQDHQSRRR